MKCFKAVWHSATIVLIAAMLAGSQAHAYTVNLTRTDLEHNVSVGMLVDSSLYDHSMSTATHPGAAVFTASAEHLSGATATAFAENQRSFDLVNQKTSQGDAIGTDVLFSLERSYGYLLPEPTGSGPRPTYSTNWLQGSAISRIAYDMTLSSDYGNPGETAAVFSITAGVDPTLEWQRIRVIQNDASGSVSLIDWDGGVFDPYEVLLNTDATYTIYIESQESFEEALSTGAAQSIALDSFASTLQLELSLLESPPPLAVPLPPSAALFFSGLLGFIARRRMH